MTILINESSQIGIKNVNLITLKEIAYEKSLSKI